MSWATEVRRKPIAFLTVVRASWYFLACPNPPRRQAIQLLSEGVLDDVERCQPSLRGTLQSVDDVLWIIANRQGLISAFFQDHGAERTIRIGRASRPVARQSL
jgi:hypothetical protein